MADKIDSLFRDVQPLAKVTEGKPAPHENLADILEIVAVASGIRPAHLQGQRQHDDQRLAEIEGIAERHGLKTIRTKTLKPFFHRTPRFDQGIIDFENADNQKKQDDGPDVVWVYLDENVAAAIPGVVAGHGGISTVLGYPECCVIFESERKIALGEAYAQGIIDTYHAASPDEVVRLWKGNVQVQVAVDPDHDIHDTSRSLRRFPYLQLVACRTCSTNDNSAAARINHGMRDLAFGLAPSFGRRIWQARDLVINKGRPIPVGRNDPCRCGRGGKYKHCCLRDDPVPNRANDVQLKA